MQVQSTLDINLRKHKAHTRGVVQNLKASATLAADAIITADLSEAKLWAVRYSEPGM